MALVTCPYCGTIFASKQKGCPTCTYRLPLDQITTHRLHPGQALERTGRWLRRVAGRVQAVLPHHSDE